MPTTTQILVMNQAQGPAGNEICGYHTFKNALLSLLFQQNKITEVQFINLITRMDVFDGIYQPTKQAVNIANQVDLTLPQFIKLLRKTKSGMFDFLAPSGVTKADLMGLPLTRDGTEQISVVNFYPDPNAPGYGLNGMEDDLFAAAALAKFAKTRGTKSHVFALGVDNKHWLTTSVTQNAQGERSWHFMDSWYNQTLYMKNTVATIENILNKTADELSIYLLTAYESSSDLLNRRYNVFFDATTGLAKSGAVGGFGPGGMETRTTKEFFVNDIDNLKQFTQWIKTRFTFMQTVDWLSSTDDVIRVHVSQIFHLSNYIVQNTTDEAIKTTLGPIVKSIQKNTTANSIKSIKTMEDLAKSELLAQQQTTEALRAIRKKPKPTEGFGDSLVRAIVYLLNGLKNVLDYVARSIGLVN